jgi:hypothetical protein
MVINVFILILIKKSCVGMFFNNNCSFNIYNLKKKINTLFFGLKVIYLLLH